MPDRDVVRFADDLARVAGSAPARLALAVSGGPDSMAMLLLAATALQGRVIAATVDHALRAGSAEEAAMVAQYCGSIAVPHAILRPDAPIAGSSLQARARAARYALLAAWAKAQGADCLATAHHADDQAETFLMRAARGSGLAGLSGIRARIDMHGLCVIRPLLGWRRAELRTIARRAALPFVDDSANEDRRHDRTRFRALLDQNPWLDVSALADSAAHLAETDADMRATVSWLWGCRATADEDRVAIDVADLPRDLRRRLARQAIDAVRQATGIDTPIWSDATEIEALLDALVAGKGATQAGIMASARGDRWLFRPAPPRRAT